MNLAFFDDYSKYHTAVFTFFRASESSQSEWGFSRKASGLPRQRLVQNVVDRAKRGTKCAASERVPSRKCSEGQAGFWRAAGRFFCQRRGEPKTRGFLRGFGDERQAKSCRSASAGIRGSREFFAWSKDSFIVRTDTKKRSGGRSPGSHERSQFYRDP